VKTFFYNTKFDLIKSQNIFITTAEKIMEVADEVPEHLRQYFYKILISFLDREEMDLAFVGFEQEYEQFLEQNKEKNYPRKFSSKSKNL